MRLPIMPEHKSFHSQRLYQYRTPVPVKETVVTEINPDTGKEQLVIKIRTPVFEPSDEVRE